MRRFWTSFFTLAFLVGALAGCSRESNKGGPGAVTKTEHKTDGTTTTTTTTSKSDGGDRSQTFSVHAPPTSTSLKPGERKEVTVSVSRGNKFDADVMLKFDPPADLKVDPATAVAKKGTDEVKVNVEAKADASPGDKMVHVVGTGAGGPDAHVELKVTVKKD